MTYILYTFVRITGWPRLIATSKWDGVSSRYQFTMASSAQSGVVSVSGRRSMERCLDVVLTLDVRCGVDVEVT